MWTFSLGRVEYIICALIQALEVSLVGRTLVQEDSGCVQHLLVKKPKVCIWIRYEKVSNAVIVQRYLVRVNGLFTVMRKVFNQHSNF